MNRHDARPLFIWRVGFLLGTTSFIAVAGVLGARAQDVAPAPANPVVAQAVTPGVQTTQTAQAASAPPAEQVPEQVLVTGSLIRGAAAVGVPVTSFSANDFTTVGAFQTSDLFKNVPSAVILPFVGATTLENGEFTQSVNIRGLSTKGNRTLLMVDGRRFPGQGDGLCRTDPSIVPQLALDRVDTLVDGASATYGSDAVAGVINLILKRGYDGAITEGQVGISPGYDGGHLFYRGSVLFGRTWDGGDVTVTYETSTQFHTVGTARDYFTYDFLAAQGVDNRTPLGNSIPGTISLGKPALATSARGQNPNKATYTAKLPGTPGTFSPTVGTSCGNCYAIPTGQNGQGLTWASIVANTPAGPNGTTVGTKNEINPWSDQWETPDQFRNGATITFDQNVLPNVQFFADAFYMNRRTEIHTLGGLTTGAVVPTTNPYYPVGAPSGIIAYYDLSRDMQPNSAGNEISGSYTGGFNINLPHNWLATISASSDSQHEQLDATGTYNLNNVSAALGNTLAAPAGSGFTSFTKPASVPYLNVFCDPNQYTCNDPSTLGYISSFSNRDVIERIDEFSVNANGDVLPLPGGELKAAVGVVLDDYYFSAEQKANTRTFSSSDISDLTDYGRRQVWAVYGQVNVPIVGDNNKFLFVDRLDVEASARYDHYNSFGGTFNPKVSATWGIYDGFEMRGSWGTSFRAPSFVEDGHVVGATIQAVNSAAGASSNSVGTCPAVGATLPTGSAAYGIDPNCTSANQFLGGIYLSNAAAIAAPVRHNSAPLQPETAQSVSSGFEWAPTDNIFKGFDIEVTYWYTRVRNELQGCNVGTSSKGQLYDPLYASCFVTRANDPNFDADVAAILAEPVSSIVQTVTPSNIGWVADGAIRNLGWQTINGIDFDGTYSWDMGDWGNWHAGANGEYIIDSITDIGSGQPPVSEYSTPHNGTRDSGGRLRYRTDLGWNGGPHNGWSVDGFMNFFPHFNLNGGALPPECFLQGQTACNASGMPQYAQYTQQYPTLNNLVPGSYTFDLSVRYNTGDLLANEYLKNINIALVVNNILDKRPLYQYAVSDTPIYAFYSPPQRGGAGFGGIGADQRAFVLTITKSW